MKKRNLLYVSIFIAFLLFMYTYPVFAASTASNDLDAAADEGNKYTLKLNLPVNPDDYNDSSGRETYLEPVYIEFGNLPEGWTFMDYAGSLYHDNNKTETINENAYYNSYQQIYISASYLTSGSSWSKAVDSFYNNNSYDYEYEEEEHSHSIKTYKTTLAGRESIAVEYSYVPVKNEYDNTINYETYKSTSYIVRLKELEKDGLYPVLNISLSNNAYGECRTEKELNSMIKSINNDFDSALREQNSVIKNLSITSDYPMFIIQSENIIPGIDITNDIPPPEKSSQAAAGVIIPGAVSLILMSIAQGGGFGEGFSAMAQNAVKAVSDTVSESANTMAANIPSPGTIDTQSAIDTIQAASKNEGLFGWFKDIIKNTIEEAEVDSDWYESIREIYGEELFGESSLNEEIPAAFDSVADTFENTILSSPGEGSFISVESLRDAVSGLSNDILFEPGNAQQIIENFGSESSDIIYSTLTGQAVASFNYDDIIRAVTKIIFKICKQTTSKLGQAERASEDNISIDRVIDPQWENVLAQNIENIYN